MMSQLNRKRITQILIPALMLLGCTLAQAAPIPPTEEALFGKMVTFAGLHIQVPSHGCTDKSSFKVIRENVAGIEVLTFLRVLSDECRALHPYGVVLTYSFEELGLKAGEAFALGNVDSAVTVFKPWRSNE